MGIKTTSRSESLNSQVKRSIRILKRNKNCRILTVFDNIIKSENDNFEKKVCIQKEKLYGPYKGNLAVSWNNVFTRYSYNLFQKSLEKIEQCSINKVEDGNIYYCINSSFNLILDKKGRKVNL
ncbi:unnamed protein product [Blepharisma stoltei]|uniref:Transposase n=1 Tax=Blepharisma stoltei TaxID=1481888 RepID=A0AAU9J6K3_9CILI|nr:unnamed protein product [Blepharisma stoltei]